MSNPNKKQEEKHLKILRDLLLREDNKICFDCPAKNPSYVDITISTFVCARCSGLVREFGHRVKSVYASLFTPQEIEFIQSGGNTAAKQIWMATWNPKTYPIPDVNDTLGVRAFMRTKYELKRWYKACANPVTAQSSTTSSATKKEPTGFTLPVPVSNKTTTTTTKPKNQPDFDFFGDYISSNNSTVPPIPKKSEGLTTLAPNFTNFAQFTSKPQPQSSFASFPPPPPSKSTLTNSTSFANFQFAPQVSAAPQQSFANFGAMQSSAAISSQPIQPMQSDPYAALRGVFDSELKPSTTTAEISLGGFTAKRVSGIGVSDSVLTPPVSPFGEVSVLQPQKVEKPKPQYDFGDLLL
ncbi:hypothetical protein HK098_002437 [Nowakowskiella sp. JEL0407]|nr:hypothetical protein HK098_002437 [Nowakowskiella sp. JEL0407]